MEEIKLLQCGDMHFDTPFTDLTANSRDIRREEIKETFTKIIDLALQEKVNIILITGDIFDNSTVQKNTLKFLKNQFLRVKNIPVFISAGNHDPINLKSFYNLIEWPNNVKIFGTNIEKILLEEINVIVYGVSFGDKYLKKSIIKDFKVEDENKNFINIMCIHGDIISTNSESYYNPITIEDIENTKLDYLALGHKHNFSDIHYSGQTGYCYSGCPEGRGFDEIGEKGVVIANIKKANINIKFIPINKRTYYKKKIDVTNIDTIDEIKEKITSEFSYDIRKNNLFKIILIGEISDETFINEDLLQNLLKDEFFFIKIKDETKIKNDIKGLALEYSLKGIFSSKLINAMKNIEEKDKLEELQMALKLGLKSLSEGDVNLNDY